MGIILAVVAYATMGVILGIVLHAAVLAVILGVILGMLVVIRHNRTSCETKVFGYRRYYLQMHLIYTLPFFVANNDAAMLDASAIRIKQIEPTVDTVRSNSATNSFIPVKIKTAATPYFT